jgi:hypothetical protein
MRGSLRARSCASWSDSTPQRWEPGITCSGPFSVVEASRWTRSAMTLDNAQAGACA